MIKFVLIASASDSFLPLLQTELQLLAALCCNLALASTETDLCLTNLGWRAVSTAAFYMANTILANGSAVYSGGAIHTEAAYSLAPLTNITIIGNEAISFGGGITSFGGSNITLIDSDISENLAGFYAGGVLALYGLIYASGTKFNRNKYVQHQVGDLSLLCHASCPLLVLFLLNMSYWC